MLGVRQSSPGAEPAKPPRLAAQLPSELVWRIRREASQLSERLNAVYHRERYAHMPGGVWDLRTEQSELGRLLHWILWERTWSAAGPQAPFYKGDTVRRALEGLRDEDRQREQEDD